jgi:hypothetical protein
MDSHQENLIYHFIRYYKSLGIPVSNWKIILHGTESKKLLEDNHINYEITLDWSSDLKTKSVNSFIQTIKSGWLIYADLDEFFDYGKNLELIIKECDSEIVVGDFVDRFANDFELKPILKEEDIFKIFYRQSTSDMLSEIYKNQNTSKIMLVKISGTKKPIYLNTHTLKNLDIFKVSNKKLVVNHFRWSMYSKDCIRKKLCKYILLNESDKIQYYKKLLFMLKRKDGKYYVTM